MSKPIPFPPLPSAFTVPHGDRIMLWVQSPSGYYMLLSGSWLFNETARLFAERLGYKMIATDVGMLAVEAQMEKRADDLDATRVH
jgi:hypothetical protein